MVTPVTRGQNLRPRWKPLNLDFPKHDYPGKLIAFEGIDGSGKSTLIKHIEHRLVKSNHSYVTICSPSPQMREYWAWEAWHKDPKCRDRIDELGLTIMAMGDRLIVQRAVILPALKAGKIVLCDRYVLSVLTYWSTPAHRYVASNLIAPNLGLYCRVSPKHAAERAAQRKSEPPELHDVRFLRMLSRRYNVLTRYYGYKEISTGELGEQQAAETALAHLRPLLRATKRILRKNVRNDI